VAYRRVAPIPACRVAMAPKFVTVTPHICWSSGTAGPSGRAVSVGQRPLICWDCLECCVLSGRGLCDELITRPEESYRLARRCVWCRNLANEEALVHWEGGGAVAPKISTMEHAFCPPVWCLEFWSGYWVFEKPVHPCLSATRPDFL